MHIIKVYYPKEKNAKLFELFFFKFFNFWLLLISPQTQIFKLKKINFKIFIKKKNVASKSICKILRK